MIRHEDAFYRPNRRIRDMPKDVAVMMCGSRRGEYEKRSAVRKCQQTSCYNTGILTESGTGEILESSRRAEHRSIGLIPDKDHSKSRSSNVQAKRMALNSKSIKLRIDKETEYAGKSEISP